MHSVGELGAVLGIWAHPDDETYLSGGIMAAAVHGGQRVACVTATAGERGTPDPVRWPPEQLGAVRREELAQALGILGVTQHHWLGYADGHCADVAVAEVVATLARIVEQFRPDTILTFGADGITGHLDHITVGDWAVAAAAESAPRARVLTAAKDAEWVERFAAVHDRHDVFLPGYPQPVPPEEVTFALPLPDDLLDRKAAALRAQRSQTAPLIDVLGWDLWRSWIRDEAFVRVRSGA